MMILPKISPDILQELRVVAMERYSSKMSKSELDIVVAGWTADDAFDRLVAWRGMIGVGSELRALLDTLRAAERPGLTDARTTSNSHGGVHEILRHFR